jgi:hypothetical protein
LEVSYLLSPRPSFRLLRPALSLSSILSITSPVFQMLIVLPSTLFGFLLIICDFLRCHDLTFKSKAWTQDLLGWSQVFLKAALHLDEALEQKKAALHFDEALEQENRQFSSSYNRINKNLVFPLEDEATSFCSNKSFAADRLTFWATLVLPNSNRNFVGFKLSTAPTSNSFRWF